MKIPTSLLLAFAFAIYFNRYAPIYSALILILVMVYAFFDLMSWGARWRNLVRMALVFLIVMLLVVVPTVLEIQARRATAPFNHIHDGAIQTEEAIKFLLAGKNPYSEDYTQTPMAYWPFYFGLSPQDNPALFYLPYFPFSFVAPLPFYLVFQAGVGFFDLRMYHLILFVGLFCLLFQLSPTWNRKLGLAILVGLNPLFVQTFIEGRNDVVVLWWLVLAFYLLQRHRITLASIALGLACVVKATAWFAVPFFLTHLWFNGFRSPRFWLTRVLIPILIVGMILVVPFVVWDVRAFVEDALLFQSSMYQISGQGFSRLLLETGIVPNERAAFPFVLLQFLLGLPVLLALWYWQAQHPTLQRALVAVTVLGFVIGYAGRAFADNHIGFVLALAFLAWGIGEESAV